MDWYDELPKQLFTDEKRNAVRMKLHFSLFASTDKRIVHSGGNELKE